MSAAAAALLAAAGVAAGVVGTAGGITSLVSYPALLAAGIPAWPASIANVVAVASCWPGSALASRPELAGRGPWLLRWTGLAAAGGVLGSVLLLVTPPGSFSRVVPFLAAAGSVTLLLQPRLSAIRAARAGRPGCLLAAGLLAVSVYSGYFGAGSGVMTLSLLLLTVDEHLPTANALKNMMVGAASVVAAVTFAAFGHLDWAAALALGAGMFAGSLLGPRLARLIPAPLLRWLIALLGAALAVRLWLSPA